MLIRVKRHSKANMTANTTIAWIKLVTILTNVLLMALWAPTTSLLSRLINSPILV